MCFMIIKSEFILSEKMYNKSIINEITTFAYVLSLEKVIY